MNLKKRTLRIIKKEITLNWSKELREAIFPLKEIVKASWNFLKFSLECSQIEDKISIDNFMRITIQIFYDVVSFDRLDYKDEFFKNCEYPSINEEEKI